MSQTRATHAEGCLFCRSRNGPFASAEHIIGQAFGSYDHILPPGVVCDPCNNGPLSRADRAFADFDPLKLLRSERGIPTRSGHVVVTKFREAEVAFTEPGVLSVFASGPSPVTKIAPGKYRLTATSTSRFKPARARLIMRAMWKTVIEYIYVDYGPASAYHPELDPARREVIGKGDGHGWVVVPKTAELSGKDVQTTYQPTIVDGQDAILLVINIYGARFYSDLLRRRLSREQIESAVPWPANVWVFPKASTGDSRS